MLSPISPLSHLSIHLYNGVLEKNYSKIPYKVFIFPSTTYLFFLYILSQILGLKVYILGVLFGISGDQPDEEGSDL